MNSAHMYCPPGNGELLEMKVINPSCQVITEAYTFQRKYLCPAITRFANELGGKVVVMGSTLNNNHSQNLLNYRKQRILQDCLLWCDANSIFVKEAARVFTIYNEATNPEQNGFQGMLTLSNLNPDSLESVSLVLPKHLRENREYFILDKSGNWVPCKHQQMGNGIEILEEIRYMDSVYFLIK